MLLRRLGFTAVPQHGFKQVAGTAVMQELGVATDGLRQADAPQRRRAPVAATGLEFGAVSARPSPMSCSSKSL